MITDRFMHVLIHVLALLVIIAAIVIIAIAAASCSGDDYQDPENSKAAEICPATHRMENGTTCYVVKYNQSVAISCLPSR